MYLREINYNTELPISSLQLQRGLYRIISRPLVDLLGEHNKMVGVSDETFFLSRDEKFMIPANLIYSPDEYITIIGYPEISRNIKDFGFKCIRTKHDSFAPVVGPLVTYNIDLTTLSGTNFNSVFIDEIRMEIQATSALAQLDQGIIGVRLNDLSGAEVMRIYDNSAIDDSTLNAPLRLSFHWQATTPEQAIFLPKSTTAIGILYKNLDNFFSALNYTIKVRVM